MWSWIADLVPPQVPADDARRAAERILARPEYREPQPSLLERILDAIGNFLQRAIDSLAGSGPGGPVATVVVAVLVAVAVWFLVRAVGASWRRAPAEADPVAHGTSAPADPATWLAEARRLAEAGRYAPALRCRRQAMVASLVAAGVVDDVPGRTPRELAGSLATLALDQGDAIASVTDRFERAWYGGEPVTADGYATFDRDTAALERALVAPRRPAEVAP